MAQAHGNPILDYRQAKGEDSRSIRRELLMGRSARMRSERLAEKLLYIRNALGLSQGGLIRHLEIDDLVYQSNVSGFESGEREPPLPILLKYARAAGVCVDVLIDDELELPGKLPSTPEHRGVKQKRVRSGRKRR
jgi:transcriptional regulator with XRE-family HTH domain